MKVTKKPLVELHEAERNVRGHTSRQIAEYVRSVEQFGQMKPIVCDESGEIIIGNGLFLALKEMGIEKADCYVVEGWTDEQKKKLMLADNKVYELGMSLDDVMQDIVREIGSVDIPGYSEDILSAIMSSVSDVTKAVTDYGKVPAEMLKPITAAASDESRPPMYDASASSFTTKEEPPNDIGGEPLPTVEASAKLETERYVTCPHCGQRFAV